MRRLAVFLGAALVAAACSSGAGEPSGTSTIPTTTAPQAEPAVFTYSYTAGDTYRYDLRLQQHVTMHTETSDDPTFFGSGETPSDVDVTSTVAGSIDYTIGDGPEPGTVRLDISGVFDDLSVEGTIDGEPAADSDLQDGTVPDLIEVPDVTVVVDESGRIVSVNGEATPDDAGVLGDPFAGVAGITSGGIDRPFGPQFPDRPLAVGDTWTEEITEPIPDLDQEMTSSVTYTVTGLDTIDGHDVAVIEFTAANSGIEIDLGEAFQAMFDAFAGMAEDAGDTADIPTIEFVVSVDDSEGSGTFWFDQKAGVVRQVDQTYTVPMTMRMAISATDGDGAVDVSMAVTSNVQATLAKVDGISG